MIPWIYDSLKLMINGLLKKIATDKCCSDSSTLQAVKALDFSDSKNFIGVKSVELPFAVYENLNGAKANESEIHELKCSVKSLYITTTRLLVEKLSIKIDAISHLDCFY